MNYRFFKSLRWRLLLLSVILLVAINTFLFHLQDHRSHEKQLASLHASDHLTQTLTALSERTIYSTELTLAGIEEFLRKGWRRTVPFDPGVRAMLLRRQEQNPQFLDLLVVHPDGKIIHWTGPGKPPSILDREYYLSHLKEQGQPLFIGEPKLSKVHQNRWFFGVSRAMRNQEGRLMAILVAIVDSAHLSDSLGNLSRPEGALLVLRHRRGLIVACAPEPELWVGQRAERLDEQFGKAKLGGAAPDHPSSNQIYRLAQVADYPLTVGVRMPIEWHGEGFGGAQLDILLLQVGSNVLILFFVFSIYRQVMGQDQVRAQLSQSETRYRLLAENTSDVIWTSDPQWRLTYVSPAARKVCGYEPEELMNRPMVESLTDASRTLFSTAVIQIEAQGAAWPGGQVELEHHRKDGSTIWTDVALSVMTDEDGILIGYQGSCRDITPRKQLEEKLRTMAITDPLTGCFNRRHLAVLAERELSRCQRHDRPLILVLLDIDHFKAVNDRYGHPQGDLVLLALVRQLRREIRGHDLLVRYGGEEFVLLLPETDRRSGILWAEKVRQEVERMQIPLGDEMVQMTISLGVADLRADDTLEHLLSRADHALYAAKQGGRNRVETSVT